jgi:hypothetical protein
MTLRERLNLARLAPPPAIALAAPRCARCGELIHLLRVAPERWAGPYYHAACSPNAREKGIL